jgi:hypothetical protein
MGDAADVLLQTISSYLVEVKKYGPHACILNSSGTGKSRMVDELSKTIITVPICLREGSAGMLLYRSLSNSTFRLILRQGFLPPM